MPTRESFWMVDDQAARLAELVSQGGDSKEAPLRRDVRSLGRLLGEVLKEQVGDELFTAVAELRSLLIAHRELRARPASENAEGRVEPRHMSRALAIYLELTQLAETNHRRRRRRAARSSTERLAQPGCFLGT